MLYHGLEKLRKKSPGSERHFLEGVYLFNNALDYLINNPEDRLETKESKINQITSMENAIDKLLEDIEAGTTKPIIEKKEYQSNSSSLQKTIVAYVVSQNYSNDSLIKVALHTEAILKSGGVQRALTAHKKEFDKKCSEHFVLKIKYEQLGK